MKFLFWKRPLSIIKECIFWQKGTLLSQMVMMRSEIPLFVVIFGTFESNRENIFIINGIFFFNVSDPQTLYHSKIGPRRSMDVIGMTCVQWVIILRDLIFCYGCWFTKKLIVNLTTPKLPVDGLKICNPKLCCILEKSMD